MYKSTIATATVLGLAIVVSACERSSDASKGQDSATLTAPLGTVLVVSLKTPVLGTVTLVAAPGEGLRGRMTLALTSAEPTVTGKESLETSRLQLEAELPTGDAEQPAAIAAGHLYLEAGRTLQFTLSEPAAFALRTEEGN